MGLDVCMVPAPFCAVQYINDGRDLSVDETQQVGHKRRVRVNNAKLYQTCSLDGPSDFQPFHNLAIRALLQVDT